MAAALVSLQGIVKRYVRGKQQILDLLRIVNREQHKTIIMVTHDPKAAERATRQLHLDKGRLIDADSSLAA
jgi:ABC-type lipoprotein export system ATPase subunit